MQGYWPEQDQLVDEALLSTIGVTRHALERFVDRAVPGPGAAGDEEAILRDCMLLEGRVTYERPRWSKSSNEADWYVQVGEFLLCIVVWDSHYARWAVPTVVNGASWKTWTAALERGWTQIPLPPVLESPAPPRRLGVFASLRVAQELRRREPEKGLGFWGSIGAAREEDALREQSRYRSEKEAHDAQLADYQERRQLAHAAHCARYGA